MTTDAAFALNPGLEAKLLHLWIKFLKRSDLSIDDDFFESGGDSLLAEELLLEVEQLMQTKIPPSLLFETGTVRGLAERLGRTESLVPKLAVRIGGEGGRVFHFFHGDFTHGGVSVRGLAAMLGQHRPTLAIAPHGGDGERVPASIEEMAADRLSLILEAQPSGPYLLGGHCAGALVAFETARLLVNAGHRVELVVMIDPVVVALRPSVRLLLGTLDLAKRAMGVPPHLRRQSVALACEKLANTESDLRQHLSGLRRQWNGSRLNAVRFGGSRKTASPGLARAKSAVAEDPEVLAAYSRVMSAYRPSPLAVPVLYVALGFSGGGWRGMSPEIELVDAPDVDHNMSGDSGAAVLGRVRERLDVLDPPAA